MHIFYFPHFPAEWCPSDISSPRVEEKLGADVIWPWWSLRVQTAVNFGQLKVVFCRKLSPLKQTKASQGHKQDFQNTPQFLWVLNWNISSLSAERKDSNAMFRGWGASSNSLIRIHKNCKCFQSTISSSLCQGWSFGTQYLRVVVFYSI